MTDPTNILAARAASTLLHWLPADETSADAHARVTACLVPLLQEVTTLPLVFETDADPGTPGKDLRDLMDACDLRATWPAKHCLAIHRGNDDARGMIEHRQRQSRTFYLVTSRECWLLTDYTINPRLRALVVDAVRAGNLGLGATIEPLDQGVAR